MSPSSGARETVYEQERYTEEEQAKEREERKYEREERGQVNYFIF